MAKFDLFNELTWAYEPQDYETLIANKALGHIGSRVGKLQILKQHLQNKANLYNAAEFTLAKSLSKEVAEILQVKIEYPDSNIEKLLCQIDSVLDVWARGTEYRQKHWKELIPTLKILDPYIQENLSYHYPVSSIVGIASPKVSGNAAWQVYLEEHLNRIKAERQAVNLSRRLGMNDD